MSAGAALKPRFAVATVIGAPMFRRWARMLGEEHWLADPRFADDQARADHGEIIGARMSAWCEARSRAAHLLEEQSHPSLDATFPLAPTPIELSATPGAYRRPAPLLGEHTDEILARLGYAPEDIAALRAERVI